MPVNEKLSWITGFIWGIADDVLRDLYVRGKYRDVILPMTVLRRLDAVLEPTKQDVLDMKTALDSAKVVHPDQALRQAAGLAFYNTSRLSMRDLKARASRQRLKASFEAYLDGFAPNWTPRDAVKLMANSSSRPSPTRSNPEPTPFTMVNRGLTAC